MNSQTLEPTHHCFDDAMDFMDYTVCKHRIMEGFWLVHGICENSGVRHAHAWVEDADFAIFSGILDGKVIYVGTRKEDYYKAFGVTETTKYDPMQMLEQNLKSGHYGPWEEKYKELCKEGADATIIGSVGDLDCFRIGSINWNKEDEKKIDRATD